MILSGVFEGKTYSAREEFDKSGDGKTLAEALNCAYSEDYSMLKGFKSIKKGDIMLVLGAGDFYDRCSF